MMDNVADDRLRNRLEVYNTIILAIATLAVTWCSYQATMWNGIQTFSLAESNKYSRLAQQKTIQAGQTMAMDEAVLIEFITAAMDNDRKKMDFILKGVKPELSRVMSEWLQMEPLKSPSVTNNPLMIPPYQELMKKRMAEADQMSASAQEAFDRGRSANTTADRYSLFSVMFSMVMFLGAITTRLVRTNLRLILTIISSIICAGLLILVLFNMPIALKG